jgi:hypothetical protein
VLYEGVLADFLGRYPGLDPVWDEDRRRIKDGYVDLWIQWSEVDGTIDVRLEHWELRQLSVTAMNPTITRPRSRQRSLRNHRSSGIPLPLW